MHPIIFEWLLLFLPCFVLRSAERSSNNNKWHSSVKPLGVLGYQYFVNIIRHSNLFRHFLTTFDKLLIRFVFQNSALLKRLRTRTTCNDTFFNWFQPKHIFHLAECVSHVKLRPHSHYTREVSKRRKWYAFYLSMLHRRNLNLELYFWKTRAAKSHDSLWRHRLRKAPSPNCYPPTRKRKNSISNSSGLKAFP